MAIYLFVVFLFNGISSLFSGKSWLVFAITQVVLIIMFAYMSIYTTPQDNIIYQGYYLHPEWAQVSAFEPGFMKLMEFSRWIGLDYLHFRLMIAVSGYFLIALGLFRLKVTNRSLFYVYYMLMPFVEDPIQLRNFLMATIVMLAFSFLVNENSRGLFWYISLVLISSTIQSLGLLFLLIVPFYKVKNVEKVRKLYLQFSVFMCVIFAIPFTRKIFANILGGAFQQFGTVGNKISSFLYRAQPGLIIFADVIVVICILLLLIYINRIFQNDSGYHIKRIINLGINLCYSLFGVMPIFFLAYNFDRMIKDSLFIFFAIFAGTIPHIMKRSTKKGIMISTFIFLTILGYSASYYSYGTGGRWNPVVYPVIFNNQFGKEFSDYY